MKKIILVALLCAPISLMAQKFGHFNSQEVVAAMPETVTAQNELKALGEQYENDLKTMQEELQKKSEAFEKEQASLLENIKQRRQAELQDLYQRYQQSVQDNQQAFQKAQTEKFQVIQEKVLAAVKKIGEEGGYTYIMDTTAGIPFINEKLSIDITPDLKKALGI